ncbi:MAG: YjjG family noncanonical pyrimidine nucleotidase [Bacteroidales bacterium]|jgi:2-haloacid dehalogenase|nr:YjjG family noncanonical pyrimidine nucleotidase [Bacteroidales bacterium]
MQKSKSYTLLFIDADDTLYDFQKCEMNALVKTFNENKIEASQDHIDSYSRFNHKLWKDLEKGLLKQDDVKHERFRLLVDHYNWDLDYLELSKNYIHNISNERVLMPDALKICEYLSVKYTIILLTNGIAEIQRGRFENSELRPYFNKIAISDEAGCSKPDPAIFDWALDGTEFNTNDEMLIIGDSLTSDIQGGINYGIDTCWLNVNGKSIGDKSCTYEITTLKELTKIV